MLKATAGDPDKTSNDEDIATAIDAAAQGGQHDLHVIAELTHIYMKNQISCCTPPAGIVVVFSLQLHLTRLFIRAKSRGVKISMTCVHMLVRSTTKMALNT